MDRREYLGVVVQYLTDRPISGTIVTYDLWQSVVTGLETQHGFLLSTHPCYPMWSLNNHEDKDASLLYKPNRHIMSPQTSATVTKFENCWLGDEINRHLCWLAAGRIIAALCLDVFERTVQVYTDLSGE